MRGRLMELLLLIFISLTGCGNDGQASVHVSDVVEMPEESDNGFVSIEQAVKMGALENTEIVDTSTPDQVALNTADSDEKGKDNSHLEETHLTYIERTIGDVTYTVPDEWYMEERDDRGFLEHTYYEYGTVHANNFMAIWYLPLWKDGATAEESIDEILSYTKSDTYCDSFEVRRATLDTGIEVIEYRYHMNDDNYEECGYYIPVRDDGILTIFYDPKRIYDDDYISEIGKVAASVRISEPPAKEAPLETDEGDEASGNEQNNMAVAEDSSHTVANDGGHNYYKNVSDDGIEAADTIARQIAASIVTDPAYTTDLQKVTAAAQAVKGYCDKAQYGRDTSKYYRSPYGVFMAGVYTCAGSTRALGRILDYMGYSWQHTNENQNRHQWCALTMDGQIGFADGMSGIAGYGTMTNGMTLPDGNQVFFAE